MKNNMDKISIIVIGYNAEKYMARFLDSALSQKDDNFEVIFVDDGSTDGTAKIAQEYSEFVNYTYLYKKNGGIVSARKKGVEQSSGKYILMADSDDFLAPDALMSYRNALNQYAEYDPDIIITDLFENGLRHSFRKTKAAEEYKIFSGDEYLKDVMSLKIQHFMFGKLYKRSFILCAGYLLYPNVSMAEDWMSNILFGYYNPVAVYTNTATYYYCFNVNSMSRSENPSVLKQADTIEYIEQFFSNNGIYEKYYSLICFLWFSYAYHYLEFNFNYKFKKQIINRCREHIVGYDKNEYCIEFQKDRSIWQRILFYLFYWNCPIAYLWNSILITIRRRK